MATAKQSEVKWVPKDKKTGKGGFLALRSAPNKPFSGTVTGIKEGSTTTRGGKAVYKGGRNVAAVAERRSARVSGGKASTTSSSSYAKPSTPAPPKGSYPSYLTGSKSGSSPAITSSTKAASKAKSPTPPTGRGAGMAATARPTALQAQIQRVTNQIAAKRKEIEMRAKKSSKTAADAAALKRDRDALANLQKTLNSIK